VIASINHDKVRMIVTIVLVVVVLLVVTSLTLLYMKRSSQSKEMYSLSSGKKTVVLNSSLPWNMATPSSIRFAVYIKTSPKTVKEVHCENAVDTTTMKQSCTEYSYSTCTCSSRSDCLNCKEPAHLVPLLSLGSSVKLLSSGYVSQSDKPFVSTLLTIKTGSGSNTHIESVSLPAIPLQKWTVVTIVQEGRRIDVFYGAKSVASTYLKYTPIPAHVTDSWMVGGMPGWVGQIGLFSTSLTAKTSADVESDIVQLVDTTGLPYTQNEMDFSFDLSLPSCLFGTCSGLPPVKPPNPFSVYATSVS
jgi:hypothetical protein